MVLDPRTKESRGFGFVKYEKSKVPCLDLEIVPSFLNQATFVFPAVSSLSPLQNGSQQLALFIAAKISTLAITGC